MSKRWTMEELEKADDLEFAARILSERQEGLNPYSPLSVKLRAAAKTIETIMGERMKYMARLVEEREKFMEAITGERSTRNMTADEYDAYCAEVTLKTLNELMAKLNLPDRNPLTAALVKASYEVIDIKEGMQAAEAEDSTQEPEETEK